MGNNLNVNRKKLYAYIDESGQNTKGKFFVVSILIISKYKDELCETLEIIEMETGKKDKKWNKSRYENRKNYIERVVKLKKLQNAIFFDIFRDTKEYINLTSFATSKAILKKAGNREYKVTVFVDGFRRKEIEVFGKGLRDMRIKTRKIRGVKRDENNALIRLVDAICGLINDAEEGDEWAKKVIKKVKKEGIMTEI